jgi:hypothetical protein
MYATIELEWNMRKSWSRSRSLVLIAAMLAGSVANVQADPMGAAPPYTTDPNHIVPTTGWWWASSEAGRGYSVEVNVAEGTAFIATYVYDDSGNPMWYVATLTGQPTNYTGQGFYGPFVPQSTPYTGNLMLVTGGQTMNGPYKPPASQTSQGVVNLTFTSSTQGTITWPSGAPFNGHSTTITRYDESNPSNTTQQPTSTAGGIVPQNGWWWNSSAGGSGYFWEVQGTTAFVAAYVYRADGTPVWYVAGPAQMSSPSSFSAMANQVSGGPTLSNPSQPGTITYTPVGQLTITFSDATHGTLSIANGAAIPVTRYSF